MIWLKWPRRWAKNWASGWVMPSATASGYLRWFPSRTDLASLAVGSEVGIEVGDRFSVLDGSAVLTGLDGQRYILPGPKIGEITINRVSPRQSFGAP
jgi:hypothetical protein